MSMNHKDQTILRDLAKQVVEIADLPIMAERREMWKRHNRLERVRPMILVFPEGAWRELLPESTLECKDGNARGIERNLRMRLYYPQHLHDDTVIEKEWIVHKVVNLTGWGLTASQVSSTVPTGAWGFDSVIKTPKDLKKLKFPEVRYDEEATQRNFEDVGNIFGDILDVKLKGISRISFHLMNIYTKFRGLEQVMWDMSENPAMLHDAMAFFEEGHHRITRQYEEMNLLSLNNDSTYHSSGGVGYTDELPQPDYDPDRIRPCDMWASAEAQEMDGVSPEMHEKFIRQYEKRLLKPFGLNGYGCCEDPTLKLDDTFQIPNIRRISIAPFADVDACAKKLQGKYIFSWKPNPAFLVGMFDAGKVRKYIEHTLGVSQDCVIEIILKDTHTCEHQPERFTQWTAIARELVENY